MLGVYNNFAERLGGMDLNEISESVTKDSKLISWSRNLFQNIKRQNTFTEKDFSIVNSLYRPFTKTNLCFSKLFNDERGRIPTLFPKNSPENLVIMCTGVGAKGDFSALMSNQIPDLQLMFNGQCFPHVIYPEEKTNVNLFSDTENYIKSDGVNDFAFEYFRKGFQGNKFSKDDLFYFIYGLFHSNDFKIRFQNNLSKELPRIPLIKNFGDFMKFSQAGRKLGYFHVSFENVEPYQTIFKEGDLRLTNIDDPLSFYRVEKMRFQNKNDKSTVIYNKNITIENIPLEAYEYVVNGKPALEWVMERQCVKTDKASGIVNDANDYANETMNNPAYPLELFQRVITVSLETMKIIKSLPKLDIE
jgi:predicted helicase